MYECMCFYVRFEFLCFCLFMYIRTFLTTGKTIILKLVRYLVLKSIPGIQRWSKDVGQSKSGIKINSVHSGN